MISTYSTSTEERTRTLKGETPILIGLAHRVDMNRGVDPEIYQQIRDLMNIDPAAVPAKINRYLEQLDDIKLDIAIIGETGSGKSSFVNTFRGTTKHDPEYAPVGVTEFKEPISYTHPNYPNVILWDLPGIGGENWPRDTYVKKNKFEKFHFFIIISDTHYRENDVTLVKETKRLGKRFYFVHSKIDQTLSNEEKNGVNFNAETTVTQTRDRCIQGLLKHGVMDPQVFLVSNFDPKAHDFPLLHKTFAKELFDLKKHALPCTMAAIHLEVINNKKVAYKAEINKYAATSALGALVPIPGLSVAVDIGMVVKAVTEYVIGFGLDPSSLHKLSTSTGVPYDDLRFTIQSLLVSNEITGDLIIKLLTQLGSTSLLLATEEWTRFIPILGLPIAAVLSFTATYRALNFFLDELANEGHKVYRRALGLNIA